MGSGPTKIILIFFLSVFVLPLKAQLKFIAEDFEGMYNGQVNFKNQGLFAFGNAALNVTKNKTLNSGYSGSKALEVTWKGKDCFGGWGIGLGRLIQLDPSRDHLNFYLIHEGKNSNTLQIKIILQEDDNGNGVYEESSDDSFVAIVYGDYTDNWKLFSIPLSEFKDNNKGGDGELNIGYKNGKLFACIFNFNDPKSLVENQKWLFDFISFSKGELPVSDAFQPRLDDSQNHCLVGAWSEEGNQAKFSEIPMTFESLFKNESERKLSVVHFFLPFSSQGNPNQFLFPSKDKINDIISRGYLPMITLENHYVNVDKKFGQPNLFSITEGHFDKFFREWANRIKDVNGTVLLRILHEFNGDWYPWCIRDNNKDPQIYIEAFRRIHTLFRTEGANNVKFIWCPNSMSVPQEPWNYILDAYPGNEYVDYVGMDIYNGAGEDGIPVWRSFRREGIENYFLFSELLPSKPILICETSSRERKPRERGDLESKAEWIRQMSECLSTDMARIRMLAWFNEYQKFKVNSSEESRKAFLKYVWNNEYFVPLSKSLFTEK